jgi:GT2 family glycosyltransferase
VSRNKQVPVKTKLLDIVIAAHGRFDLLTKCLNSIPNAVNGKFEYNIVLVDNASDKDEAREFYSGLDGSYTIIRNQENLGFPKACNQGARRKTSPLILMLNSDVILWDNSLTYMVETMDDPNVGICGMKLLFPEDLGGLQSTNAIRPRGKVQHVGIAMNIRTEVFHIFLGWDADHPKVNAMRNVNMVTGAVMMIRRNVWNKVGGFLEDYGLGTHEDVDFCLSARKMGYNVVVETKAVGYHYTGASAESANIHYPLNQNRLLFLQRWQNELEWDEIRFW